MAGLIVGATGNAQPSIPLVTRRGTPIPNFQERRQMSLLQQKGLELLEKKYSGYGAKFLGPADPMYNCHGMTLASRRTWVMESDVVRMALREDGYREVPHESAQPGDLVVYFDEQGQISHSGIVVRLEPMTGTPLQIPFVLSKWAQGQEVLHQVGVSEYGQQYKFFRIGRI